MRNIFYNTSEGRIRLMSNFDLSFLSFVLIGFVLYAIKFMKQKDSRDKELLKKIDYLILLLEENKKEK